MAIMQAPKTSLFGWLSCTACNEGKPSANVVGFLALQLCHVENGMSEWKLLPVPQPSWQPTWAPDTYCKATTVHTTIISTALLTSARGVNALTTGQATNSPCHNIFHDTVGECRIKARSLVPVPRIVRWSLTPVTHTSKALAKAALLKWETAFNTQRIARLLRTSTNSVIRTVNCNMCAHWDLTLHDFHVL